LLGVASCSPDFEPVTWKSLDTDIVEDALASPTAPLNEATRQEVLALPGEEIQFVYNLLLVMRAVLEYNESVGSAPMETDADLSSTQVYLKVACAGPFDDVEDAVPDPDFRYGSMTVYSETLSEETIEQWSAQGNMLAVFDQCVRGDFTYDGRMRTFFNNVRNLLVVVPEIDYVGPDSEGVVTIPAAEELDFRLRLLFTTSLDQTLVLERDLVNETTEFTVRGADGELRCDAAEDPRCPPL
jgi:hypothetical protein